MISAALDARAAGDLAALNRVVLALTPAKDPVVAAAILAGLTHFSTTLDDPTIPPARSADLRCIFSAALNIDFSPLLAVSDAEAHAKAIEASGAVELLAKPPTDIVPLPLLAAYREFIRNTASADSAFVEQLLTSFARHQFKLALPAFTRLLDVVHDTLAVILDTYPRAEAMLIRVITDRYPHAIRPCDEHTRYARALLTIASYTSSHTLAASLISIVIERIAIIDAMVPDVVGGLIDQTSEAETAQNIAVVPSDSCAQFPFHAAVSRHDPPATSPLSSGMDDRASGHSSPCIASVQSSRFILDPVAAKMDGVLAVFMEYVATAVSPAASHASVAAVDLRYDAILHAFERYVLPSQAARHSPFVVLHAAATRGHERTVALAERFRVSFFDPSVPPRVRVAYLHCSTAIIGRASCVTSRDALAWTRKVAAWVHTYLDNHATVACIIDTDVHDLFYAATFALLSAVSLRPDIFDRSAGGDEEAANKLRFLRIMSSGLNPLLVMPEDLVTRFCRVVVNRGSMDLSDIVDANRTRSVPSRTRFGTQNRFRAFLPLEPCALPLTCARVERMYRHNICSVESNDAHRLSSSTPGVVVSKKRARSSPPSASLARGVSSCTAIPTKIPAPDAGFDAERPEKIGRTI
jgi:RNA polymerase I specific transcription initiation factor RRN3